MAVRSTSLRFETRLGGWLVQAHLLAGGVLPAFAVAPVEPDAACEASVAVLHDLDSGKTTRPSVGPSGIQGDGPSERADVSNEAGVVVFASVATNLVVGDTNGASDVFAHARCDVRFEGFGFGLAGTGGLTPFLSGEEGTCASYALRVWNGLGGSSVVVAIGVGEIDFFPFLGGHLYVDPTQGYSLQLLALSGPAQAPGAGAVSLPTPNVSALAGSTLILQGFIFDPAAPQGLSSTRGLRMKINE